MIIRCLVVVLLLLNAFLAYKFFFGDNGYLIYRQECQYEQKLSDRLSRLNKETYEMSQDIRLLKKDSTLLEKEIRCRLHYARPNEILYMKSEN